MSEYNNLKNIVNSYQRFLIQTERQTIVRRNAKAAIEMYRSLSVKTQHQNKCQAKCSCTVKCFNLYYIYLFSDNQHAQFLGGLIESDLQYEHFGLYSNLI